MRTYFMKTRNSAAIAALMVSVLTIFNIGCSGSSSNDSSNTSSSVLQVSPANPTVAAGGTLQIVVSGGTAPYYFTILTAGATAGTTAGTFTSNYYIAPTSLTSNPEDVSVQINDSAGNTLPITIAVTGTSVASTLQISPVNQTVAPSGTLTFSATGGTLPYTYSVVTSGGGSFTGNIYTAPTTASTYTVQVMDAVGAVSQTSVIVSSTASSGTCEGTYSLIVPTGTGTLDIVAQDSGGAFAGNIKTGSSVYSISGTCSLTAGTITFSNNNTGYNYTGTIYESISSGSLSFSGNYTNGTTTYTWSATQE